MTTRTLTAPLPGPDSATPAPARQVLRRRRLQLGVSQQALAARIGRSRKWLSELESGQGSPGFADVAELAAQLGLSLTLTESAAIRVRGASLPGDFSRPNEDRWGTRGSLAWVIDGATQPLSTVQDVTAAEYASALSEALSRQADRVELSLTEILKRAIAESISWPRAQAGPAATVALLRRTPAGVDWLVLGDAAVIVPGPGGALALRDERLAGVAVAERAARSAARAFGSPDALAERSLELYRAERAARNRPGGYWVAADDPAAAEHAMHGHLDADGPLLLASDGALDAIGPGGIWPTLDEAVAEWLAADPELAIARTREHRQTVPGAKVDDATLVLVR
ncbi:helix-turn-helix domain-containing protein [Leucobacter sp. M11]|uniref:helix-turn-helix domain-containing protein n=1 Tax=Leucobacter sp. M11 TaxID=2993565 RepID=UPI002D7F1286|nr:helix-turn-helix domain-containing protein [Leucobacter sp. M11]MEB4613061.1 helix-turn-helix domain-containing protein [Leucobacter sp. M11]